MRRNQEQLKFAVDLAQQPFTARDLPKLRRDLETLLDIDHAVGGLSVTSELSDKAPSPEHYSLADFENLKRDTYTLLADIIKGKTAKVHSPESFDLHISLSAAPITKNKYRSVLFAYGSTRDAFLFKLFLLLGNEAVDKILTCEAPDCTKIFFRNRGQRFCSTKCDRRDYMRGKRRDDKDYRELEKEKAHERYKKRMRKLYGKKKKIVRRPRKKTVLN